jgi:Cu/Ag efflux protein CusF
MEDTPMKTRKMGTALAAAVCVTLGLAGCAAKETAPAAPAAAAAPLPSGTVGQNAVTATATVKSIDQKTRKVTLQRPDGSLIKFRAGDQVRNLAQVKVGDTVKVTYYESLAYEVKKPGQAVPGAAVAEQLARAEPGEKPGAAGARVMTVTATIAGIDKAAGTVTLRGPDGQDSTIKVRYPEKLNQVSVGDLVQLTYTEAVGISVQEPSKQ